MPACFANPSSQRGIALVTGLMFLVVLTLIALSALKSTSLEERMAGNARDQELAFEAAEAGVRDALRYIAVNNLSPASPFAAGCAAGLCLNDLATPVWQTITANDDWTSAKTLAYSGAALTSDGVKPLANQPHYIIELLPTATPPGFSMSTGKGLSGGEVTPFRITSRGWGVNGTTQATVQTVMLY